MSVAYICDRCGRQSSSPRTEGWVKHLVSRSLDVPVDYRELARNNDMCHDCREEYEGWFAGGRSND